MTSNMEVASTLGVGDPASVDRLNSRFYSRFPFPRPPLTFPRLADPLFETMMLNQSLGDFTHTVVPAAARIWVAGCGTNQAVYTALRFPRATVVGSDLSRVSLDAAGASAASMGVTNLELRQESLNQVLYFEEFDYIICTGVIHHNANPAGTLSRLARALRRDGVLELMVYNRWHRLFNAAFATAVRTLSQAGGRAPSLEDELALARVLADTEPMASNPHVAPFRRAHESHLADALIQPVEYSYTVETLEALLAECGLALMLPCFDQFDCANDRSWTLDLAARDVRRRVEALSDVVRWQLANLLMMEQAPFLWFYVRHRRSDGDGRYEIAVNDDFLDRVFTPAATTLRNYVHGPDGGYTLSSEAVRYPLRHRDAGVRAVVDMADGRLTTREIMDRLHHDPANHKIVTDLRMRTTTPMSPYLRAL
jgi:SAM-dependent methyltransferase